jgi:oxygen-independent coproporphyrinogen-3 oxidase
MLSVSEIASVLSAMKDLYTLAPDAELTIEANPGTITQDKLCGLRRAGINRISIGVQSMNDRELQLLGRSHTSQDAVDAVRVARKAGFDDLSIDLIYGIPGQSMEQWERTLSKALSLSPEHISSYELTPENDTPLAKTLQAKSHTLPDEEAVIAMYYRGIDVLEVHGYVHYELSNFAKPGRECVHNLNYWNRGTYLGIGAGAHSFIDGKRSGNVRDVVEYIRRVRTNEAPVSEETILTDGDALKEHIFLGLRKTGGLDLRSIPGHEGIIKQKAVEELLLHGLIEVRDHHLRLTRKGLVLSSEIMVRLLEAL